VSKKHLQHFSGRKIYSYQTKKKIKEPRKHGVYVSETVWNSAADLQHGL
jgi:hypothetical protein